VRGERIVLLAGLLLTVLTAGAAPVLRNLDIRVLLQKNGDARITEVRQMQIDSEGTECYIGLATMGDSQVKDLEVSDETGLVYTNIGSWDVERSRQWKEGKCGIAATRGGYELCWGLGQSGERTYTTSYTLTGLVRSYPDADAIRHVFMDAGVSPKPESARLIITSDIDSVSFTADNCGVWGFRFGGELSFEDGNIVVWNTEPFGSSGALYVMVYFVKGMFEPWYQEEETFEEKKQAALEGSDYTSDDEMTTGDVLALVCLVLFFAVMPVVLVVWNIIYVWRARKKVNKDLLWYRDIPLEGNLQEANKIINAYSYFTADYNNLLSACILKLINMGAISIEQRLNAKGKQEQNFVIHDLPQADRQPVLLRQVHDIFRRAAGQDTILEPKELKQYMRSSYSQSITDSFITTLHSKTSISKYKDRLDEVRQLFGLKKFLKEFSLLNERHVGEVSLWKDYMIYATLFGIADQVIRDMKKINPEYFNMDQVARQMADDTTLPMIYSTMHSGTARAAMNKAEREARASGRGGSSSWGGGGGGFSGGGGGGGVR